MSSQTEEYNFYRNFDLPYVITKEQARGLSLPDCMRRINDSKFCVHRWEDDIADDLRRIEAGKKDTLLLIERITALLMGTK